MSFKSYGNVPAGQAVVMKLATAAVTSSSAPSTSDLVFSKTITSHTTSKTALQMANGNIAVLLW